MKNTNIPYFSRELALKMREADPHFRYLAATVLDGDAAGAKILICCEDESKDFPRGILRTEERRQLCQCVGTGMLTLENRTLFYEKITAKRHLVICGSGHVGIALTRIASMTGFKVTVIDDRPKFTERALRAGADQVLTGDFIQMLSDRSVNDDPQDMYYVVVTREHMYDLDCLRSILPKPHAYLGMMGSRRKTGLIRKKLMDLGFAKEQVLSIHMPIGLAIGAQTPEEIAVSILAELIQTSAEEGQTGGFSTQMLDTLLKAGEDERYMLSTVIRKQGSAPRGPGAKMLIRSDGAIIATIGGGEAEDSVISLAKAMCLEKDPQPVMTHIDMTAGNLDEELMVCGGSIDVWIEPAGGKDVQNIHLPEAVHP